MATIPAVNSLGHLCLNTLVKNSRVYTKFQWTFMIPKLVTWYDALNRVVVPLYTNNYVFEAFCQDIDWSIFIDQLVNYFIIEACHNQFKMAVWTNFVHKFRRELAPLLWRNRFLLRHIFHVHRTLIYENCDYIDWLLVSTFDLPTSFVQEFANYLSFQRLFTESPASKKLGIDVIGIDRVANIAWNEQTISRANRMLQEELVRNDIVTLEQLADSISLDDNFLEMCVERANNNCSQQFWKNLSRLSYASLSSQTIEKYKHELDWFYISSSSRDLKEHWILEFGNEMNWSNLSFHGTSLTPRIVEKYFNQIDWINLSAYGASSQLFTHENIEKWHESIDFGNLPVELLSLEQIDKWQELVNWSFVSMSERHTFPLWFIQKYAHKIDWFYFCARPEITEALILSFSSYFVWSSFSNNIHVMPVSNNMMNVIKYHVDWYYLTRLVCTKWRKDFAQFSIFVSTWQNRVDWAIVSKYKGTCSINFLRKYANRLEWASVLNNFRIKIDFQIVFDFQDRMAWPELVQNFDKIKNPTEALLIGDKFANEIDMRKFHSKFVLTFKYHPPEWFLTRHFDKLDSTKISQCATLTPSFLSRFKTQLNWRMITRFNSILPTNPFLHMYSDEFIDFIYWPLFPYNENLTSENLKKLSRVLPVLYFLHND